MNTDQPVKNKTGLMHFFYSAVKKANKVLRFLGVRTVVPHMNLKYMQKPSDIQSATQLLSDRKTEPVTPSSSRGSAKTNKYDHMKEKYVGFRANKYNLIQLKKDLYQAGIGKQSDESDALHEFRIEAAMVLSGMARYSSTRGQLTGLKHQWIHRPIKEKQLDELQRYLDMPKDVLFRDEAFIAFLANNISKVAMTSVEQAREWFSLCRDYMAYGAGAETLKEFGFMQAQEIESYLPKLTMNDSDRDYLDDVNQWQKPKKSVKPTSLEGVRRFCDEQGIAFREGTKQIPFSANDKSHQCLVVLHHLQNYYVAKQQYLLTKMSSLKDPDSDEYKAATEQYQRDKALCQYIMETVNCMTHTVMVNGLPDQFSQSAPVTGDKENLVEGKPFSYQHTILTEADGTCLWNSDDFQPRGGRCDTNELELFSPQWQVEPVAP